MSLPPRIACMTMVKDDVAFLDIWARYYGGLFGAENCVIVDHGSTDQSALDRARAMGMQVLRIPFDYPAAAPEGKRPDGTPVQFDLFRFGFMSKLRATLRVFYDIVIFHDVDEVLLPHPDKGETLIQTLQRLKPVLKAHGTLGGQGVELFHNPETEGAFDPSRPVLQQRRNAHFRVVQCKPVVFQSDVASTAHTAAKPFALTPDLWLLHLKFLDRDQLQARQEARFASVQRGEVPDWTRWGWNPNEIDDKLREFRERPLDTDDQRLADFLAQHFTPIEAGCVLVDRRQDKGQEMFYPPAGLPPRAQRLLHEHRFILAPAFQSLAL